MYGGLSPCRIQHEQRTGSDRKQGCLYGVWGLCNELPHRSAHCASRCWLCHGCNQFSSGQRRILLLCHRNQERTCQRPKQKLLLICRRNAFLHYSSFAPQYCLKAFGAAGRKKFIKVKYFIGSLSYGTKTQRDFHVKILYGYLYAIPSMCLIEVHVAFIV